MKNQIEFMTREGFDKLNAELETAQADLAPLQAARKDVADTGGDAWHDNFAFEQLEIQERGILRRIFDLKQRINRAKLIEHPQLDADYIQRGSWVTIEFEDSQDTETYRILGSADADPRKGVISDKSPLGATLLGARVGDHRQYIVEGVQIKVTIVEVRHANN